MDEIHIEVHNEPACYWTQKKGQQGKQSTNLPNNKENRVRVLKKPTTKKTEYTLTQLQRKQSTIIENEEQATYVRPSDNCVFPYIILSYFHFP